MPQLPEQDYCISEVGADKELEIDQVISASLAVVGARLFKMQNIVKRNAFVSAYLINRYVGRSDSMRDDEEQAISLLRFPGNLTCLQILQDINKNILTFDQKLRSTANEIFVYVPFECPVTELKSTGIKTLQEKMAPFIKEQIGKSQHPFGNEDPKSNKAIEAAKQAVEKISSSQEYLLKMNEAGWKAVSLSGMVCWLQFRSH